MGRAEIDENLSLIAHKAGSVGLWNANGFSETQVATVDMLFVTEAVERIVQQLPTSSAHLRIILRSHKAALIYFWRLSIPRAKVVTTEVYPRGILRYAAKSENHTSQRAHEIARLTTRDEIPYHTMH